MASVRAHVYTTLLHSWEGCHYTALLFSTSISENDLLVSHERPIMLMLYELALSGSRKTGVDDMSNGTYN